MMFMGLYVVVLLVGVFGAVDAAVRPFDHWQQIGGNKALWIVLQLLVLVPIAGLAGLVATIIYLSRIRPKLKAVAGGLSTP